MSNKALYRKIVVNYISFGRKNLESGHTDIALMHFESAVNIARKCNFADLIEEIEELKIAGLEEIMKRK